MLKDVKISEIKINERVRQDMGDLLALAESITAHGVLQPLVVTPDLELICGERTLCACRDILGWDTITAKVCPVASVFLGQIAPNLLQKAYTVSERVAIVEALRSFRHGGDRRSDQVRNGELETLTIDDAAKRAGLGGKDSYYRAKTVLKDGVPELIEAMDKSKLSLSAAAALAEKAQPDEQRAWLARGSDEEKWVLRGVNKQLKRVKHRKDREGRLQTELNEPNEGAPIRLYHSSFQRLETTTSITPSTAQLICTDIPYGDEFMAQIEELAAFGARVLVPGGVFVAYVGQHRFNEKLALLDRHLKYRWLSSADWDGVGNPVHQLKMVSKWISVVIYSKGEWTSETKWIDRLTSSSSEKNWHEWQRPLEDIEKLVKYFSKPGDLVIDPCAGGFTTALACHRLGRRCISCDTDEVAVVKGHERLGQEKMPFGHYHNHPSVDQRDPERPKDQLAHSFEEAGAAQPAD